jgi:hypothetical protein
MITANLNAWWNAWARSSSLKSSIRIVKRTRGEGRYRRQGSGLSNLSMLSDHGQRLE